MVKGLNLYCFICGGPTCKQFADCDALSTSGSNPAPWASLPGLTPSDSTWLCDTTVAVYADCISPPGIYQRKENRLRPAAKIETQLGTHRESGFVDDLDKYLRWGGDGDRNMYREMQEMQREMEMEFGAGEGWVEEPVSVPDWARAMRPGDMTDYPVDIDEGVYIAHETCLFLATAWSKAHNPSHYSDSTSVGTTCEPEPEPDDVLKFGMCSDMSTHIASFLIHAFRSLRPGDLNPTSLDPQTAAFIPSSSSQETTISQLGATPDLSSTRVDFQPILRDFTHGLEPTQRSKAGGEWLEGRKDYNFYHRKRYGITHLKRPDYFPRVREIEKPKPVRLSPWTVIGTPVAHGAFKLFPACSRAKNRSNDGDLPLEIILRILKAGDIDDSDARSLECVSRSWRDFFRTSFIQRTWWRDVCCKAPLDGCLYLPTTADWTLSADEVRWALGVKGKEAERLDWRGYFNEARKSLNIQNRRRILECAGVLEEMIRPPPASEE